MNNEFFMLVYDDEMEAMLFSNRAEAEQWLIDEEAAGQGYLLFKINRDTGQKCIIKTKVTFE